MIMYLKNNLRWKKSSTKRYQLEFNRLDHKKNKFFAEVF